jgi:C_GCAxxG_C_C family probable redox protein
MNRKEKALDYFSKGFNCAQSVIVSFSDIMGLNEETALRMASGFGGGMGRMQGTCGTVTGAFMVIGFMRGKYKQGDDQAKEITNQLIQDFSKKFVETHGNIDCKGLIHYDLNTPEGNKAANGSDVFNKKCTQYIISSVDMLEKIILKEINQSV